METITISKCCKAGVDELENEKFECWDCGKECEVEEVCEECRGTGEIGDFDDIVKCRSCGFHEEVDMTGETNTGDR